MARAAAAARPIGAYAARALDPAARARGFATTALLERVAGNRRRRACPVHHARPGGLAEAPRRGGKCRPRTKGGGTKARSLVLRVEGPRAIEVQHRSGQILERVNAYFGYRAIAEMRILQAPVARKAPRRARVGRRRSSPTRFPPRPPSRIGACAPPCCGSGPTPAPSSQEVEALSRSCQRAGVSTNVGPARLKGRQSHHLEWRAWRKARKKRLPSLKARTAIPAARTPPRRADKTWLYSSAPWRLPWHRRRHRLLAGQHPRQCGRPATRPIPTSPS